MIYNWKAGTRSKVSAQVAGEVCAELEREGELTPEALVDASRSEGAPLHEAFEWNDSVAAEQYRTHQARYIIRSLETEVEPARQRTRAFVTLERTKGTHEYHSIEAVFRNEGDRESLLARAKAELRALKRKYETLAELRDVFDAIDALDGELSGAA